MSQPGPQTPPSFNLPNSIMVNPTFTQHNQIYNVRNGERAGFVRLLQNVAPNALYDSGHLVDPPKCHPNTRTAIIQTVIDWSSATIAEEKVNAMPILWLKGGAGAGKSAIARSVAERGYKEGLLLGTFFFGAADTTRNHVGGLVATLAYQLCIILPECRDAVTTSIEDDPLIFSRSLSTQFTTLLMRPLAIMFANHSGSTRIPRLVIIDGLDECSANIDSQQDLLFTLQEVTSSTSLIRFLVCSRPESHLNSAFSSPRMATISYKIFLDDDYSAQKDIKLYLEDKFREIKDGHPFKHKLPSMWPGPGDIWHLASKSSGQFIYAATVVRYIQSPKHRPNQRLDAILNLRPPFKDLPFTELDALYRHIISKAEDPSPVLDVLGFPVLYGEFNVTYVEKLLQLEEGDVEVMLADLQSLVMIDRKMAVFGEIKVKLLHKSLGDFLCDSQRAGELYMDLSVVRVQNITHLISAVSTTFKHNGLQALDSDMAPWLLSAHQLLAPIQQESCGTIHDLNCEKARYVSSDILQAALEFPTFDLVKQMHTDPARHQSRYGYLCSFLSYFLSFLRSVKDVQESARQIYLQQIRQYCEAVLYLLEDDLSNDSKAHFIYTYYHLLGPRLCQYFLEYLHVQQLLPLEGGTSFGYFICNISASAKVVTAGFARLLQNAAPNALHDSGHLVDPPKCHPNTRTAIIQTVFNWSSGTTLHEEMNAKPILWLKGGAGAGKSAIARSVAEQCSKEGLLLGTFFFGAGDATRNHVGRLVATQAYQLCIMLPEFRDAVTTLIEDDPLVFSRSITTQFTDLIIHPLSTILSKRSGTVKTPRLIIIDGVDECSANVDSQRDLLFTLQEVTSSTSLIRFLVCSRPESHLNNAFSSSCMANIHYKIFLDDNYSAQKDIELYLEDKFQEIKEGHTFKHKLPMMWPKPGVISNLADKSSGQFIYASTVIRYIESPRHRPDQRLDAILNLRPPFKDLPFTELDALYRHIISKAEDPSTVLDILCFPVLYGEFNVIYLEKILQLEEGDVEVILADLQSLVTIYRETTVFDPEIKVELLHKSLGDFLCDSQRAGDLYQDLSAVRGQHSTRLISMVSTTFKHNGLQALGSDMAPWLLSAHHLLAPIRQESHGTIHDLNGEKARYVSSKILQAALEFPTFDLVKKMHTDPARHQSGYTYLWRFLSCYLTFLHSIKDVQESARQIYLQQIRQYCEAVLSLLEDDLPNNWKAHFIYASYHLLRPHLCQSDIVNFKYLQIQQFLPLWDDSFGDFVYFISSGAEVGRWSLSFDNYLSDILAMSNDLTKGAKQEAIFALSASFCLAFLCDNQRTAPDARRIFEATGIDQRRRREHPWRWRRMISWRRSLGNQPVIMECAMRSGDHPKEWRERLGNMRKAFGDARIYYDSVSWDKIYTIPEFLHINKHRRDTWLRQGIDIHRQPIHRKQDNKPYQRLPARYHRKQEWVMYMLLLDLLPRFLSSSGRYEPLVKMCRTKCLASLSRCWPKRSRRARQAIETYLQRMDLEENK